MVDRYLSSPDIEYVRLGALILTQTEDPANWQAIMDKHSRKPYPYKPSNPDNHWEPAMPYFYHDWFYCIDGNEIIIFSSWEYYQKQLNEIQVIKQPT